MPYVVSGSSETHLLVAKGAKVNMFESWAVVALTRQSDNRHQTPRPLCTVNGVAVANWLPLMLVFPLVFMWGGWMWVAEEDGLIYIWLEDSKTIINCHGQGVKNSRFSRMRTHIRLIWFNLSKLSQSPLSKLNLSPMYISDSNTLYLMLIANAADGRKCGSIWFVF